MTLLLVILAIVYIIGWIVAAILGWHEVATGIMTPTNEWDAAICVFITGMIATLWPVFVAIAPLLVPIWAVGKLVMYHLEQKS